MGRNLSNFETEVENMNKTLKMVLSIVGGVVVIGAIAVALIHFWEDIKKLCPACGKDETEEIEDFADYEM